MQVGDDSLMTSCASRCDIKRSLSDDVDDTYGTGKMTAEEFMDAEAGMSRSAGSCNTMGTASTMASMVRVVLCCACSGMSDLE